MNTRKVLTVGAALALLSLPAVLWNRSTDSDATPASPSVHFRFPKGERWTYQLEYAANSRVELSGTGNDSALSGRVLLVGDLVLRGYGEHGASQRVGLRLENLARHSLQLFGQEVLPDAASVASVFQGHEALLEVGPEGDIQSVSFRPEDPSLFKNTVQALVGELQVVLRDGATWTVDETTTRGRARVRYEKSGEDASAVHVLKQRTSYTEVVGLGTGGTVTVDSRFEADVARSGTLDRLDGHETVARLGASQKPEASTEVTVRLTRGSSGRFEAGAVASADDAALQKLAPGQMVMDPKVREQMLTQQVAGLTPEKLLATLKLGARGGVVPDQNHFLLQATGLLEQQPELCAKLVEAFQSPEFDVQGRALVLDLLANTGTPAAQEALTKALATPEARGDKLYHMLLGRLALVTEPTESTVRFVETTYGQTQGDVHVASAYMLGATAGALYRNEHSGEALAAVERLASDLRAAKAPREQVDLLMSLGNAGVPEQAATIASYAGSDSPEVRRAAAKALRKIQTPEARTALMGLVGDSAVPVQATAMESLGRRKLDAPSLVELRDVVIAGSVRPENFHTLVTLVEPYLQTEPAVRDILEYLLVQDVQDRQIRTRIRGLLGT